MGVAFETQTHFPIRFDVEGLQVPVPDEEDVAAPVQKITKTYHAYLPYNINVGIKIPITKKAESYFDYTRSYWSKISKYDFDKDDIRLSMGIRYSLYDKLVTTLGYYIINTHRDSKPRNSTYPSPYENELLSIGLIYKWELFNIDFGYATVVNNKYYDDKKQSFLKLSIATYLDNFFNLLIINQLSAAKKITLCMRCERLARVSGSSKTKACRLGRNREQNCNI